MLDGLPRFSLGGVSDAAANIAVAMIEQSTALPCSPLAATTW